MIFWLSSATCVPALATRALPRLGGMIRVRKHYEVIRASDASTRSIFRPLRHPLAYVLERDLSSVAFQSATSHFFPAPVPAPVETLVLHVLSGTWQSP